MPFTLEYKLHTATVKNLSRFAKLSWNLRKGAHYASVVVCLAISQRERKKEREDSSFTVPLQYTAQQRKTKRRAFCRSSTHPSGTGPGNGPVLCAPLSCSFKVEREESCWNGKTRQRNIFSTTRKYTALTVGKEGTFSISSSLDVTLAHGTSLKGAIMWTSQSCNSIYCSYFSLRHIFGILPNLHRKRRQFRGCVKDSKAMFQKVIKRK